MFYFYSASLIKIIYHSRNVENGHLINNISLFIYIDVNKQKYKQM